MANAIEKLLQPTNASPSSLSWKRNPAAKKLLDTLVQIIVEEFCQKAKQNPDIFSNPK